MQYFGFDRPSFGIKTFGFGANPDDAILALFAGGKQGVWYDPSDKSTMYQDLVGKLPVTKDGDPVGLILDKSQGLEREILDLNFVNATASQFSFETITSIPDGLSLVGEGISAIVTDAPVNTNAGDIYEISFSIKNLSRFNNSYILVRLSNGNNGSAGLLSTATTNIAENGDYKFLLRANYNTANMYFSLYSSSNISYDVTNATFKKIKGNHASQPLTASRPTYRTDGELHWLEFDGTDDGMVIDASYDAQNITIASGIEKLSDASTAYLLASTLVSSEGDFGLLAPSFNGANSYRLAHYPENTLINVGTGIFAEAPITNVVFASVNGIGGTSELTIDGKSVELLNFQPVNSMQNTGLILGYGRNTGSLPPFYFRGNLYGMIFISKQLTASQKANAESYLAKKSGVTL